jgi:hypothetical protein
MLTVFEIKKEMPVEETPTEDGDQSRISDY